jgi:adenylylsulfate kinase
MNGLVLWITGLPGSGKSTITEGITKSYPDFVILRMDEVRRFMTPTPSYSEDEREIVYRAIVYMAKMLSELKHNVIIDATGNKRRWRELARENITNFAEIYIKCPIDICQKRETERLNSHSAPKDIYKKGLEGSPVPGVSVPYEEPLNPELTVDTSILDAETCIIKALDFISELFDKK